MGESPPARVLVTGSRTFTDGRPIAWVLSGLLKNARTDGVRLVVIDGAAPGADRLAGSWARAHSDSDGVGHESFPADWDTHGKAAGPIRNQEMLDEGTPDLVLAFVDKPLDSSVGTRDMVRRAEAAGLPVYVIEKRGTG